MGRRVKFKLQDTTPARVLFLDPDATEGATLGTNVFTPNGIVGTPATVRAWLGVVEAPNVRERPAASGVIAHRLLQGLTLGDDHPQYTQWVQNEVITGAWIFQNTLTVDIGTGADPQWQATEAQVEQTVPFFLVRTDEILSQTPWSFFTFRDDSIDLAPPVRLAHDDFGSLHVVTNANYASLGGNLFVRDNTALPAFMISLNQEFDEITLHVAAAGVGTINWNQAGAAVRVGIDGRLRVTTDGLAAVPAITVGSAGTSGMWTSAGVLRFSVGGVERLNTGPDGTDTGPPFRAADGSQTVPSYTFYGTFGSGNGMYRSNTNTLGFTTDGTLRFSISDVLVLTTLPIQVPTIELGHATQNTLSASAGVLSIEGHVIPTVDQAQAISAQYAFSIAPLFANTLTPPQITANNDNYAPTGIADAVHLRLSTDASRNLTGITTGANGRFLVITNIGGFPLVLQHNNSGSTAANRFFFDDGNDATLGTEETRLLWYDTTTARWRTLLTGSGAGGSQAAIQFQNEGVNLGGAGTVDILDFVGATVAAARVGNTVTVTVTGGSGGTVNTIVAGNGIFVDDYDPANPIISVSQESLPDEILKDDPNAYWKLDETSVNAGANLADSSGRGRPLTMVGAGQTTIPSFYPNAPPGESGIVFAGGTNWGTRPDLCGMTPPLTGDWTWECILHLVGGVTADVAVLGFNLTGSVVAVGNSQGMIFLESTGDFVASYWESGTNVAQQTTSIQVLPVASKAYHIILCKNGTANTVTFYVNGRKTVTSYATEPAGGSTCVTYVGGDLGLANMALQHVAVYNKVLSDDRVMAHMRASGLLGV